MLMPLNLLGDLHLYGDIGIHRDRPKKAAGYCHGDTSGGDDSDRTGDFESGGSK